MQNKNLLLLVIFNSCLICRLCGQINQFNVSNCSLNVGTGTSITIRNLDFKNSTGQVTNSGLISTDKSIVNTGVLTGQGIYKVEGDVINSGTLSGNAEYRLSGINDSKIKSGASKIYRLSMEKDNASAVLQDDLYISEELRFLQDNSYVFSADQQLTIGVGALLSNADVNNFVVTDGKGTLNYERVTANSSYSYPVGFSKDTYNPLTLIQGAGAATDNIGVRCLENVLAQGTSGTILSKNLVNASWEISEQNQGGNNMIMTAQWTGSDELPGFNGNKCFIAKYINNGQWDFVSDQVGVKSGNNPFTKSRSGITDGGIFTVASDLVNATNQLPSDFDFTLFPNPTTDIINVHAKFPSAVPLLLTVINVSGQKIWQRYFIDSEELNFSHSIDSFPSGIYMMQMNISGINYSKRFIIEK